MITIGIRGDVDGAYIDTARRLLRDAYDTALLPGTEGEYRLTCRREESLGEEVFLLEQEGTQITLHYGGDRGFLYGLLETGRRLQGGEPVVWGPRQPPERFRAVKFDLPWSAYRPGTAMTAHHDTCRSRRFWEEFLDMMVLNRFNALTLWNLHPFPFMIRCDAYPEACPWDDRTLGEWQSFWRFLFREARVRGIDTYMVFWNIFVSHAFREHRGLPRYEGQYHFGPGHTGALVKDYNRESIAQMIREYPDLTGLGISMGERMQGMDVAAQTAWIGETVFEGVRRAGRPVKLIYRAPFSQDPLPAREALEQTDLFEEIFMEYKFNWSHGHSSTGMHSTHDTRSDRPGAQRINDAFWNPPPRNYKLCWMVRNEDFFILRWGHAGFIRRHIRENSKEYTAGYFIGSEGMIPARDIYRNSRHADHDWDYIFQRQWLFYHLWGHLLYSPDLTDRELSPEFSRHYGPVEQDLLLRCWEKASDMALMLARFHGSTWDYTLYAECFLAPCAHGYKVGNGGEGAFISLKDFIGTAPQDPSILSLREWAAALGPVDPEIPVVPVDPEGLTGQSLPPETYRLGGRETPLSLAAELRRNASFLEEALPCLKAGEERRPGGYRSELADLEIWGELSLYFACRLEGAAALLLAEQRGRDPWKKIARERFRRGIRHWDGVIALADGRTEAVTYAQHYEDCFIADWKHYRDAVLRDLEDLETL